MARSTAWGAYGEIADSLRARVAAMPPGSALPSEVALASEYGVARNTVRRSLGELEREGLVVALPGRGRVVADATGAAVAAYRRIADELRQRITSGDLAPGERVPSESELMATYRVSRGMARQGLAALQAAGLVRAVHGKGRFVDVPERHPSLADHPVATLATVEDARSANAMARALLEDELPRRWAHTLGVARRARELRAELDEDAALVEAAAWLHDIGYATPLVKSGFHPLDGARYLRDLGFGDRRLWTLVARHTCAEIEARARGLGDVLTEEFPPSDVSPPLLAALTYCDMTAGPDGKQVDVEDRITEILARYSPEDVVHRSIAEAAPTLRRQVSETIALRLEG